MNISTTPRRWAWAMATFVCMLAAQNAYSQTECADFIAFPSGTPTINLAVGGGGTVDLENGVLNAFGFVKDNAFCDFELSQSPSGPWTLTPVTFDCNDIGATQTWYVRVNDIPGPPANGGPSVNVRTISINVTDNIFPTLTTPAGPFARNNDATQCYYTIVGNEFDPTAFADNCPNPDLAYSIDGASFVTASSVAGIQLPVGAHTIQWRVTDASGKVTINAAFAVNVTDNEPPAIACPIDQVRSTDPGTCNYTAVGNEFDPTSFSDNCPGPYTFEYRLDGGSWVTASTLAGVVFPGPTPGPNLTTVEWRITDGGGNQTMCGPFNVTVNDNEPPTVACPSSVTVNTDPGVCNAQVFGLSASNITDNCIVASTAWANIGGPALVGPGSSSPSDVSGAVFDFGTTTIRYTVTDGSANTATCDFSVTVEDNEAPVVTPLPPGLVTFQSSYTVNVAPGTCGQTVSWYRPSVLTHAATDNCTPVTLTEEQPLMPDGNPYPASSFNPSFPAPADFFVDNGVTPYPYDPTNPLHAVTPVSAEFPVGTTTLRYFFSDGNGNITPVTITVTVIENQVPIATCQPNLTLPLDANGNATVTAAAINNGSSDNCGIQSLTPSPANFTCANIGVNIVTLTVTDFASNTATCTTTVTITETTPPVVSCPTSIVAAAGPSCVTDATTIPSLSLGSLNNVGAGNPLVNPGDYKDNCGVTMITYLLTGSNFTGPATGMFPIPNTVFFESGITPVTYTFKDAAGNSSSCSFNVDIEDLTAPTTANCPNPPAVNANLGGCQASVTWTPPTFTDECDATPTVITTHAPGSSFGFGTTQVTYTAFDDAGNVGFCTFNVVVNDTQSPVANCQNITVSLGAGGTVTVSPSQVNSGSTDNCFFNFNNLDVTYNCTNIGANNYTLTITDAGGNTASKTCTVTVADNTPGIKDPSIVNCGSFTPSAVSLNANCEGTLDAAVYASNFTITDNTLNSFPSCPLSFDVDVDGSGFAPTYAWTCADAGTNTVTFRVTDVFGNTAVCTKTVTVNDVTAPIINNANAIAPPSVTVQCDVFDLNNLALWGQITLADVQDACDDDCNDVISITSSDVFIGFGSCPSNFSFLRTWTVTDQAGNTATHTQVLNSVDTQAPTFSGVQTLVNLDANDYPSCVVPFTVALLDGQIVDNCTSPLVSLFNVTYSIQFPTGLPTPFQPGTSVTPNFPIGTSTVTFNVVDPCGNASQIVFTIVVSDANAPIFNEPFGTTLGNVQNVCGQTFTILNATGNCGNNFSWYRPFRSTTLGEQDVLDCSTFSVSEVISDPTVQSAINVSAPYVYNNPPIFSTFPTTFFPVGNTTITYTATDLVGNTSTCSFIVKVVDNQAPSIACPSDQNLSISSACNGTTTVPNYLNGVSVTDNCPNGVVLTQTPLAGTPLSSVVNPVQAGETFVVTVNAQDSQPNNLNATPCTFTVTLFDGTAPVPVLPILPAINSFCGKDTVEAPSATDCNGNIIEIIYGTPSVTVLGILPPFLPGGPPRYIIPAGMYAITWSYTDPQSNTTTQLQSVNIFPDNIPPIAQCKSPFSVNLSAAGDYALSVSEIDNGSFDQHGCGPVALSVNPPVLNCANINSPVNIALSVQDVGGNIATCVTQVTVNDITAPVLSPIPANITLEACANIPAPPTITAQDACGPVTLTYVQDTTSFTNAYRYILRRTWTAADGSGNSSTGVQFITIQDTQAPTFAANIPDTITVFTDLNNLDCKDTVAFNITSFIQDCDSTSLTITNSRTSQGAEYSEILLAGTYTLQFTVKDINNNSSTHVITLIVKDGTNPIAACINGVSVSLQSSGTVTVTAANINANSSDNCTPQNQLDLKVQRLDPLGAITNSLVFGCADADGVTQHPVKLYVKDLAGNESSCQTYVVVQDNVFPQITSCPPAKTIQCNGDFSPTANGTPTATDNCSVASITHVDSTGTGSGNICYQVIRRWEVLDQANNLTTCVQILNVQDTVKPVLSAYPPDDTVSCSQGLPAPALVTATDNCTQSVVVSFQQDTIDIAQGPCGQYSFTVVRTRTAIDDCGNTETHTRKITVVDDEVPLFLGMPDTITVRSADYPANLNCTVPVALNIAQYLTDCEPDSLINVTNTAPHGNGGLDIGGNYTVGTYNVKFTATDACGNVNVDSILVNVVDNSIPTLVCNDNVVISLGTNGEATIQPDDIDLGSTDNCGIDTMFLSESTFDCADLGLNSVTLTAVDAAGNSNFCAVNVNVMLGVNAGFSLTTTGTPESYFGADDGTATATATGGSGQFSYMWSNSATTSAITGLAAGTYIVTVTDTISGCLQVDTAMIAAGEKITLTVDAADGCAGDTISMAVTADNFINVTGFQFTLHPNDAAVGTIVGLTSGSAHPAIAPALTANLLTGNNLGIFWFDTSLTLPNGTILFYVNVVLGNAAVGSITPVAIVSTPVSLQFTQDSSGTSVVTGMVNIVNGSVEISCSAPDFQIGGDIQTWNNPQPVPGVQVSLTGDVTANQTTGVPGTYLFGIPDNTNTTVACSKSTPGNNGITGADILLIKRHVLNIQPLTSPYQFVAADVNVSATLTITDYALIQQVALGIQQHIGNSPDWKFVPASYVFPTPNPLSVPFPQSISHTPATMDFLDDDFVAVRMGDVNGSITPSFTNDDDAQDRGEAFRFRLEERIYTAGEIIEVPFKATNFNERSGWQLTINFDPKVFELQDIVSGVLPEMNDANFGTMHINEGQLTHLWVSAEPLTIADGEVLFTLKFKVLRNGSSLAEVLRPGSEITRAEAYDRDGNATKLDFDFIQGQNGAENATFALYQNQPNPFNNITTIGFRLPESGRATLRVFSASGQLVKTVVGSFEKGYNELNFRRDEFGAPGVYYYELETARNSDRKKMILMN